MKKKSSTLLNILNTDKGGRLLDNTNGPSTPSLLASLIGKSTAPVSQRSGVEYGHSGFLFTTELCIDDLVCICFFFPQFKYMKSRYFGLPILIVGMTDKIRIYNALTHKYAMTLVNIQPFASLSRGAIYVIMIINFKGTLTETPTKLKRQTSLV